MDAVLKAEDALDATNKYKASDFFRDSTAVLVSWILADYNLTLAAAAGGSTPPKLKAWEAEGFDLTATDIGSTLCAKYVEPTAWAPACNKIFETLKNVVVEQVADKPRYKVDGALVAFLVSKNGLFWDGIISLADRSWYLQDGKELVVHGQYGFHL